MTQIPFRDEVRRKLVHLSSLWMPVVMSLFPSWRWELAVFFLILTLGSILLEHAYAHGVPAARKVYDLFFGRMLRKEPKKTDWIISGGPPVLAAACITLVLFPPPLAAASMGVMLLGDTAAALIGRRWGRIRFANGKSLEGTLAFVAAGTIGFAVFYMWGTGISLFSFFEAIAAAAVCSVFELFQDRFRIDDNLFIPVLAGLTGLLCSCIPI